MLRVTDRHVIIFEKLTVTFLIIALIGLSISATVISVGMILAAIMSVLAGSFVRIRETILANPFFYALFFLWVVMTIGVFNNHFVPNQGWHQLKKYMGVWVLGLLVMPVFTKTEYRRFVFVAVVYIAFFTSAYIFYCQHFHIYRMFGKVVLSHIINPIPWSYFLAFSVFILGHLMMSNERPLCKKRLLALVLLMLWLLYSLYFINRERTGMLVGIALAVVFIFQRCSIRKAMCLILLVVFCAVALFYLSANVHLRVIATIRNIEQFFQGNAMTSIGLRLAFAKGSWHLIAERPWLGHGTGSFAMAYHTTGGPSLPGTAYLGDPHNSYLHLWVQLGLLGLMPFVVFLVWQLIQSGQLPAFEKFLMQGLVISFAITCGTISAFLRQRAVVFYVIMLIVGFAASRMRRDSVS